MIDFSQETHTPAIVHEQILHRKDEKSWDIPLKDIANKHLETMDDASLDSDWKLEEFFGTIAVINLPESKERLERTTTELHQIGTKNFTVFKAINGRKELKPSIWKKFHDNRAHIDTSTRFGMQKLHRLHQGEAGCFMSHYQLIKQTKELFEKAKRKLTQAIAKNNRKQIEAAHKKMRKYSRLLVFEDDVGFGKLNKKKKPNKKGIGKILRKAFLKLPEDWDMVYFLVKPVGKTKQISTSLIKLTNSYCTVAYAINYKMYDVVINRLKKIENPRVHRIFPIDIELSRTHKNHKVYAIVPYLCYHFGGVSEITQNRKKHNWQN